MFPFVLPIAQLVHFMRVDLSTPQRQNIRKSHFSKDSPYCLTKAACWFILIQKGLHSYSKLYILPASLARDYGLFSSVRIVLHP